MPSNVIGCHFNMNGVHMNGVLSERSSFLPPHFLDRKYANRNSPLQHSSSKDGMDWMAQARKDQLNTPRGLRRIYPSRLFPVWLSTRHEIFLQLLYAEFSRCCKIWSGKLCFRRKVHISAPNVGRPVEFVFVIIVVSSRSFENSELLQFSSFSRVLRLTSTWKC